MKAELSHVISEAKLLRGGVWVSISKFPAVLKTVVDGIFTRQVIIDSFKTTGWMNQAYCPLSTTHGHITDCKLLVCMYWTHLVPVGPAASLYSASPLKHHPTGKQWCPNPDHYSDSEPDRRSLTLFC